MTRTVGSASGADIYGIVPCISSPRVDDASIYPSSRAGASFRSLPAIPSRLQSFLHKPLTIDEMSGPPTPPPSSALEIEDATRTTIAPEPPAPASTTTTTTTDAPPTEQTSAHPPPVPTIPIAAASPYRDAFVVVSDLVTHGKFEEVVQVAETADLNVRCI